MGKGHILWESESHMVGILKNILLEEVQLEEFVLGRVRKLLGSCD
jgi:hypothetical protein